MRFSTPLLLSLPILVAADEQIPLADKLKGWFNKASSYVSEAAPAAPSVPNPVDAGASKVPELVVTNLTLENWKGVLSPDASTSKPGSVDEWMIYVTGGNKTCFGLCGNTTKAWNQSAALLAVSPNPPKLAQIDCEEENILCHAWAVGAPSIYHMLIPHPQPDQSKPATTLHYVPLNRTASVTELTKNITEIHTKKTYENTAVYEGYFHPFDGILEQYGVAVPLAHGLYWFAKMPSWLPMVLISFFSRSFMSRRMPQPQAGGAGGAPAARQ